MRTQQEGTIYEPENGPSPSTESAGALMLGFPASRLRNKVSLFTGHPVSGIIAAQRKKETIIHLMSLIFIVLILFNYLKYSNYLFHIREYSIVGVFLEESLHFISYIKFNCVDLSVVFSYFFLSAVSALVSFLNFLFFSLEGLLEICQFYFIFQITSFLFH